MAGTLSFFVESALYTHIMEWSVINVLAVIAAGFITGRVTRLIGMGFVMGFLAGLTFYTIAILDYFMHSSDVNMQDSSNIIILIVVVLVGGASGMLGAWIGTIGRSHSFF